MCATSLDWKQNGAESKTCKESVEEKGFGGLADFPKKFLFIQTVLKGLAPVDKYDWNLVSELAAKFVVGFDVHLPPTKTAPTLEFGQFFFDDLAKVASLAGIHNDFAKQGHRAQSSKYSAR